MIFVYFYLIPMIVGTVAFALMTYFFDKAETVGDLFDIFTFIPGINFFIAFVCTFCLICRTLEYISDIKLK